jgi:hypothetical protein
LTILVHIFITVKRQTSSETGNTYNLFCVAVIKIPILACGKWRNLHNDELHSLYSSPNTVRVIKSRRMRWAGHVARMGKGRGVYRVLVGRLEGKRSLGRPRRRWEDNIKMELRVVGIDSAGSG